MSTYKFWQPYQQVSLEIKQSRQPAKEYLKYLKQQQKTKITKKNKQKEPKLSETIKNTKLTAMYKKCQHQVWRILSSRQMKTGTRHIAGSIRVRYSQHTAQPTTCPLTTVT